MAKKLVIGITIPGSVPIIRGQAKYFKEQKGYDVYLMCPRSERSEKYCMEEGCTLIDVSIERYMSPFKDIATVFQIYSKLKELKPDIVNVGTPKMGLLGMIGAWMAGVKKRVYTCRGLRYEPETGFNRKLLMFTERIPAKLAHNIVCISPSIKEQVLADDLFEEEKITVIAKGSSNGVNFERFNRNSINPAETEDLKRQLNLDGKFVYGFVGRLINRKGINELYKAFAHLYDNYADIRLVLLGKKDLHHQLEDKDLLSKIESHPGIVWVGWQDNVPLYLSTFDVFVMPAWGEGFGNTYIEAANMGIPVIGTNGTGIRDAVSDGFNGIQVPIKTVEPLITAMENYYTDRNLLNTHGQNGLLWAQNFRQQIIWDGLDEVYKK